MFREITRKKQALSHKECEIILSEEKRGVLSVCGDDGYPYGMPMNHYYCKEDGYIYFHCGKKGHRADSLKKCPKVSFCVTDKGTPVKDGWALDFRSVIVFGKAVPLTDEDRKKEICTLLSLKFTCDRNYIENEIAAFINNTDVFYIVPEHITGKKVNEA